MNSKYSPEITATYQNPLFPRDCPDPYVLKFRGEYWAYCTGFWPDGRCFGILHSRDLVHWREIGGAMKPLPGDHTCYWAPEVTYDSGRFYLYYSVGNEERMQIRVAVADRPSGPFADSGHRLTGEPFAIDAHLFEDEDGTRYLFYATDFLKHARIGTGTVMDRMLDPYTLQGRPRPVTRARYDWQIYDPQRDAKGGVCWHTVEGPFVLKRKGLYYEMFSGGNWQNPSYGVAYATSDRLEQEGEWEQHCDGDAVLPILLTQPGKVVGPGHNSVVRGPNNIEQYCVYHRWSDDRSGRLLAIDRLEWAGERMLILGPSTTPQPAPALPTFQDFFDEAWTNRPESGWSCEGGDWSVREGEIVQGSPEGSAAAHCLATAAPFVCEVTVRALSTDQAKAEQEGSYGVNLYGDVGDLCHVRIRPYRRVVTLSWESADGRQRQSLPLPENFDAGVSQLLRIVSNGTHLQVRLNGSTLHWQGWLAAAPHAISLNTERLLATFSGFALTTGWEDLFTQTGGSPERLGWEGEPSGTHWRIQDDQLWCKCPGREVTLSKGPHLDAYELVVGVRLIEQHAPGAAFGFDLAASSNVVGPRLLLEESAGRWRARWENMNGQESSFDLPARFDPTRYQLFQLRRVGEKLTASWANYALGEGRLPPHPARPALWARDITVAYDMVRLVALRSKGRVESGSATHRTE